MTSNREKQSSPTGNRSASSGQRAMGAGLTLAVSVGLFAYGGLWLDRQMGTRPWFLLLFALLGIVGGMLHLIREVAPELWPFGQAADRKQTSQTHPPAENPDQDLDGPTHP